MKRTLAAAENEALAAKATLERAQTDAKVAEQADLHWRCGSRKRHSRKPSRASSGLKPSMARNISSRLNCR